MFILVNKIDTLPHIISFTCLPMPYLSHNPPQPEPIDCRILTAALDLYVENGFHNVSVHQVQQKAQVSIGSIYNHFGGKEGIASALYRHLLNEMNQMVDDILAAHQQPQARCQAIIRQLFDYTETRRNIIAYIFHARHSEFIDDAPICMAEPFQKMLAIISQGMQDGSFRRCNERVASAAIFGSAIRLIHLRLDGIIEQPLPTLYDELIDTIWQGMLLR